MSGSQAVPNPTVLKGTSKRSPSLTGDPLSGVLVAWADPSGQIVVASDQDTLPLSPHVLNPGWTTGGTPAVVLAIEWERVYVAWADAQSNILLGSSQDGFSAAATISKYGSDGDGPALAFGDGVLYIAWRGKDDQLYRATVDIDGKVVPVGNSDDAIVFSRPSLACAGTQLFALAGGTPGSSNSQQMVVYISQDQGQLFTQVRVPAIAASGPPALAVIGDSYWLAWADAATGQLCTAVTKDLSQPFVTTGYVDRCQGGGPALLGWTSQLLAGWSGATSSDPDTHPATLARLPLDGAISDDAARQVSYQAGFLARSLRAPQPHCDPLSVWDPAEEKCVPRFGCKGNCVLNSFTGTPFGPVFNPIRYALCVIACEQSS